jgi:lysylphosphatidylglycerol synthetase-like protein (DUF2156 family)
MTATAKLTSFIGLTLMVGAVGFYVATGAESLTALIPAAFGLVLAVCGLAARSRRSTKIAMHIAALAALAGVIGGARIFSTWSGATGAQRAEHLLLIGLCLILLAAHVRSFIIARRTACSETVVDD